jgi:hypothetical protein
MEAIGSSEMSDVFCWTEWKGGRNCVTVQNRTHVYMNLFDHKNLGNHLLQLCPKVVKHPVYKASIMVGFIVVYTQFQDTLATACWALTRCTNVSYVVSHEWASSLLFRVITSVLWVLTIFWCGYVKCNVLFNGNCLRLIIYACDSWETGLKLCTEVSFGKMQGWKRARDKARGITLRKIVYSESWEFPFVSEQVLHYFLYTAQGMRKWVIRCIKCNKFHMVDCR